MGKFCIHCGKENEEGVNFCIECGEKMFNENGVSNIASSNKAVKDNTESMDEYKNGNTLGIIALLLFFCLPFLSSAAYNLGSYELSTVIGSICALGPLGGIVVMIVGRVKYPNNKLLKVVKSIFVVLIVAAIILIVALYAFCYFTCRNMGSMG